jgi:hypothetical protein
MDAGAHGSEVDLGVVSADELDALAGSRGALKTYLSRQPRRRTAKRVLEAETRLARQIARGGGADTAEVQQARAAVAQARVG